MKAVILAAGKGVRINGATGGAPKCLLSVGGITLIERQIQLLHSSGISQIIVVVGCGADLVQMTCRDACAYVVNDRFETTNSLYSLWLAREHLQEGFVVLNADVLFDIRLLNLLITSAHEDALLFEPRTNLSPPLGDEEMKVRIRNGLITDIAKSIEPTTADGENVGIVKFGRAGANLLIEQMELLIMDGGNNAWAPQAFREFTLHRPLAAISTHGYPWIEIDFVEDYQKACIEILPRIQHPNNKANVDGYTVKISSDL